MLSSTSPRRQTTECGGSSNKEVQLDFFLAKARRTNQNKVKKEVTKYNDRKSASHDKTPTRTVTQQDVDVNEPGLHRH